ncbi:FAD-dependent pyridine nucleotide-disulfide oxidoreductase [Pontibacillus halophilus JSM 076056 = DSM 19796]|uniref:FAD-dependent pyridine nucleotide-disulfide oxidoreductase n=1 Tax=Pontibacillus halophilus JSM 076056 = DSM 19796 TaxID=1385510 RepID=A0A0A5GEZ2_9BACI|nr:FAD-dependent oxidoreductase [Pontibacillus halophilus]KGX90534.1 FAD-dependent pyridine nucleotide-disulfide oxidoreductase [Pontibacillus halophilus JSM 076056 = DSM 19796]
MKKYDIIVIGGGSGGLTVASGAASLGAKTALIEKRDTLGGDCLHFGCVPSKAFIEAANEVHAAKHIQDLGIETSGKISLKAVNDRVRQAIAHIQEHDSIERFEELGVDVYNGKATFKNDHEIDIEGQESLYGKRIVISTGSSPMVPPIEGLDEVDFITNESVFTMEQLPEKMTFIGGGPIGLELAQAMSRLGSEVTVIEAGPTLLGKEDQDIQKQAQAILERELHVVTGASVQRVRMENGKKMVYYSVDGEETSIASDEIFLATGRTPNSGSLQLDNAGVETDKKGFISVDATLRTNVGHIFAIGDINGTLPFTHVAGEEGKLVVQNALYGLSRKMSYDYMPWNTYLTPEVFHVGLTQQEAQEKHEEVLIYTNQLEEVDRFVTDQSYEGFVKIITDTKGKIVGAHAIGTGAGDWMQTVVQAMAEGNKIGDLSNMVYPYPNHAEAVKRTADQYWRNKLFSGPVQQVSSLFLKWFR